MARERKLAGPEDSDQEKKMQQGPSLLKLKEGLWIARRSEDYGVVQVHWRR